MIKRPNLIKKEKERQKERIYPPWWGIYMRLCQSVGPLVHRSVSSWRLDTEKEKRKESKKESKKARKKKSEQERKKELKKEKKHK
jgi:hypothetical protein